MKYYGYPYKCDICGKFHKPENGAAWLRIPACDIPGEIGTEKDRCKRCVEIVGSFSPAKKYNADVVAGVYR